MSAEKFVKSIYSVAHMECMTIFDITYYLIFKDNSNDLLKLIASSSKNEEAAWIAAKCNINNIALFKMEE
jgi:hypothetical protein